MLRKATLGLVIENDGVKAAARELDKMGEVGEASQKRVQAGLSATQRSTLQLANSMRQMREAAGANAMESMIRASDPFQKTLVQSTVAAEKHVLALGRINFALEGLAAEAIGVNSRLGSIATKFAEFGIGGPEVAAVLAGLAAIAFVFEKITEKSREAEEATARSVVHLQDLLRKQRQGDFGSTKEDVGSAWAKLLNVTGEIRGKEALLTPGNFLGNGTIEAEIAVLRARQAKLLDLIRAGNTEIERVNDEHAKKGTEALDKEWADWQQLMAKKIEAMKATEDELTRILKAAADERQRITDMTTLGIRPGQGDITSAMANTATGVAMRNQQIGQNVFDNLAKFGAESKDKLTEALKNLRIIAEVTADEAKKTAIRAQAINAALGLAAQIGGGAGGLFSSVIQGGMSGAAGGPWGVAIGGVSALVSGILSLGRSSKEAAAQVQQMKASVDATILGWRADLGDPDAIMKQKADAITAETQTLIDQLNAAYTKTGFNGRNSYSYVDVANPEYIAKLNEIKKANQDRLAQLAKEAELLKQNGLKDSIASLTSLIDTLKGFRSSIALSSLSPLSPVQQLAEAQRQYDEVLNKARGGDQIAAGQLPDVARQLLTIAQSGYSTSGAGYQQIYAQVLRDNDEITKLFQDQKSALEIQIEILTGIRDGSSIIGRETINRLDFINDALGRLVDAVESSSTRSSGSVAWAEV